MRSRFDPNTIYECERPPLIEMYIGVGFQPLPGLDLPHYGLYWSLIRDRFPTIQPKPPLAPPIAPEVEFRSESGEVIKSRDAATVRYWFTGKDDVELVQVQSDRFVRNWRLRPEGDAYPRYSELKQRFLDSWAEFLAFLAGESLPLPEVAECELGYVNRFETGGRPVSWAIPPLGGFHGLMPDVHVSHLQMNARLALPTELGSAFLAVQPDQSAGESNEPRWRLSTIAKGAPRPATADGMGEWLDAVRLKLNYLFVSSFCDELHTAWGTRART